MSQVPCKAGSDPDCLGAFWPFRLFPWLGSWVPCLYGLTAHHDIWLSQQQSSEPVPVPTRSRIQRAGHAKSSVASAGAPAWPGPATGRPSGGRRGGVLHTCHEFVRAGNRRPGGLGGDHAVWRLYLAGEVVGCGQSDLPRNALPEPAGAPRVLDLVTGPLPHVVVYTDSQDR